MRLRKLRQSREEIYLHLFSGELCELSGEVFICELLHVPLVVSRDFLPFYSSIEEVPVELAHHTEASSQEISILLGQFKLLARV